MNQDLIIHWHEGLFLRPHHLQRMQKDLRDLVVSERRLSWPYPYGVLEAKLSGDELRNMLIRFERLRAVMPSGLEVNFPVNAELPSLDIKQVFSRGGAGFRVSVGVPLWFEGRANVITTAQQADARARFLYRVSEIECADENTGENRQPVQIRKVNARLVLDTDDQSDLEILPLLKIKRAAGEDVGFPQEDREFVPPCMVLAGSPTLRELVRDLVNAVEASRKELVLQASRGGFSIDTMRGTQFEQVMRLRTLNRYSARLPSLFAVSSLSPFEMYLEFRELLGELTALHPDRDEFESAAYDHDNLHLCFKELSDKIRAHLRGAVLAAFLKVSFREVNGVLTVELAEEHLTQPNAYYLGIKTKQDPRAVAQCVEDADKFKLMPKSKERVAIRGVELKEERHPPLELPAQTDLHYFRLDRTSPLSLRRWEEVQKDKSVVVIWDQQQSAFWSDAAFTLYMTVPSATLKP